MVVAPPGSDLIPDSLSQVVPDNEYLVDGGSGVVHAGTSSAVLALLKDIKYLHILDRGLPPGFFLCYAAFVDETDLVQHLVQPTFELLSGDSVPVSSIMHIKHFIGLVDEWSVQSPRRLRKGTRVRETLDELLGELERLSLLPLAQRLATALTVADASTDPVRFCVRTHTRSLWPEHGLDLPGEITDPEAATRVLSVLQQASPSVVAEALTLLDGVLFTRVDIHAELGGLAWSKSGKEEAAPNVVQLIQYFNCMTRWVVTLVLTAGSSAKARAGVLTQLIVLGDHLRVMGNLSGVMAIVGGLSAAEIVRLRKSWGSLSKSTVAKHAVLKTLVSQQRSYKFLREALAISDLDHPAVPYFGMFLTDLTLVDDGNPDYVPSHDNALRLINIRKWRMLSAVHVELVSHQRRFSEWAAGTNAEATRLSVATDSLPLPDLPTLVRSSSDPRAVASALSALTLLVENEAGSLFLDLDAAYDLSLQLEPRRPRHK